jgi:outer membrane receptor protein involved in Fe transport
MKKIFLSLILFFVLSVSDAQKSTMEQAKGIVKGSLIDSTTNHGLESATVSLFTSDKNKKVKQTTTDSTGSFIFSAISAGNYYITIEYIGYQTVIIKGIDVDQSGRIILLDKILANKKTSSLEAVVVTSSQKLVDNQMDKLVYNAEKDITAQTGVATDVLKKVPQISVDIDGNVELEGNSGVRFLINGKPSAIFGSNITDVLQSIPASQIKSIEVITNPGAKYDAQGTGGIINIILKHSTVQGINGNVSLTTGSLFQTGSVNINARKGALALNAFVNGNARLITTTPSSFQRTSIDTGTKKTTVLSQDGSSDFNRHGIQSGIGFDWNMTERSSLSGALNYADFGNRSNGKINQSEQTQSTGGSYSDTSFINYANSSFRQYSFDPSLGFTHKFKRKDQQLDIGINGSFSHNEINAGSDQLIQPQGSLFYGSRNNNLAKEGEYEFRVDYVHPLKEDVTLGAGAKYSGYDISTTADATAWNKSQNQYIYNASLSNNLNYHQRVYAVYAEMNFPIGKLFDAKLGGRYERTQINAFYSNAQQQVLNGYNTLIPSVFLLKKIDDKQSIKLNFTIRINRPDYGELNPFINAADPKNISTGNPDLKPEVWDRYEAVYSRDFGKTGSAMISLFYRQSNGDIQPFTIYYPVFQVGSSIYTNTSVTTRKNIGIEKNSGLNIYFSFHLTDKLELRSNSIFLYRTTINQVDTGYNSTGKIFRFNLNASYQVSNSLAAEVFGNFNSRHQEAQGSFPSFISYSLAIKKSILKKKGSIAVTANNIFGKYVDQRTTLYAPGFQSISLRRIPYQSVGINFTWKFGKLVIKKEKADDTIPEPGTPQ